MSQELFRRALARREPHLTRWIGEGTDCYRLLHGVAEGCPGLSIDRYGPILLLQTWREPLTQTDVEGYHRAAESALETSLTAVWNHRGRLAGDPAGKARDQSVLPSSLVEGPVGCELSVRYDVTPRHRGSDPLLFLDLRAGRRLVRSCARGKSVLNLFGYTGGVSLCAALAGAREVWHVDFARSAIDWTRRNLELNGVSDQLVRLVREDVIPVVRQLAGLSVKGRGANARRFEKLAPRQFDLVVLDPPRWARGPFGAVDVIRDYPSLLKPALLATAPSGAMLVTNNAARISMDDWLQTIRRTFDKCGRVLDEVRIVSPEEDFPSFDGAPPTKIAWLELK